MENLDVKMRNVVFFDGVCHLCNGFVDAVILRDTSRKFLFAPLQGETAEKLLPPNDRQNLDTVVYYEAGKTYHRSAAVLKVLTGLGGIYKIFILGWLIPGFLRDIAYKFVAKNRYKWFGEKDFCRFPTPEERGYLLP